MLKDIRLESYINEVSSVKEVPGLTSKDIFLLGYPDDEGVQINNGRVGCREGPAAIRHFLKNAPHK